MRALAFLAANVGRVVTAPGGYGGQCVDLLNLFLLDVQGQPEIHANAVDWRNARIAGMRWVENSPTNSPPAWSIVVWSQYAPHGIGVYGHIALAVSADGLTLVTFDQNWPDGAPCSLIVHDYGGVVGWHERI